MNRQDWLIAALAPALWGAMPVVATEMFPPGHPLLIAMKLQRYTTLARRILRRRLTIDAPAFPRG
jgi:hypothetical protein